VPKAMYAAIKITVLCDNWKYSGRLETAWGFACLIEGLSKTILFDTGPDRTLLLNNMAKLAIDPKSIDAVVISHYHGDHTGGLDSFLRNNSNVELYLPELFHRAIKEKARACGAAVIEAKHVVKICELAYTNPMSAGMFKEQSLVVETGRGLVIVTGCAHPGIIRVIDIAGLPDSAKGLSKENILLVMGGFHLEWSRKAKIEKVISAFKQAAVQYVAPCHCTGEKAMKLFSEHFGDHYINAGAGKVITLRELE